MKVHIRGRLYDVNKEDLVKSVEKVDPKAIKKYFVNIGGTNYPIKQVISEALNIPLIAFTSMDAYRILDGLGFIIGW